MYNSFYSLDSEPFENTTNPNFFYPSNNHKNIIASLVYGVKQAKGLMLITGEIGAGKTQVLKLLRNMFEEEASNKIIEISNPKLGSKEIFSFIATCLMIDNASSLGQNEVLDKITSKLKKYTVNKSRFIVLIDEAQMLDDDSLEKIRLLSNLEYNSQKLVQLILVGQPELLDNLKKNRNKALLQRIAINKTLGYFSVVQTNDYICYRLKKSGCNKPLFTEAALQVIYNSSKGSPRLINQICDASLFLGYTLRANEITKNIVNDVLVEIPALANNSHLFPLSESLPEVKKEIEKTEASEPTITPEISDGITLPTKAIVQPKAPFFNQKHVNYLLLVVAIIFVFWLVITVFNLSSELNQRDLALKKENSGQIKQQEIQKSPYQQMPIDHSTENHFQKNNSSFNDLSNNVPDRYQVNKSAEKKATQLKQRSIDLYYGNQPNIQTNDVEKTPIEQINFSWDLQKKIIFPFNQLSQGQTIIVPEGASISQLASDHYGAWNASIEDIIRMANPQLINLTRVIAGYRLKLPAISKPDLFTQSIKGGIYIYYGSYIQPNNAKQTAQYLNKRGFKVLFQSKKWNLKYTTRLYIGPFKAYREAEQSLTRIVFKNFQSFI